jgi:hypothetical protein
MKQNYIFTKWKNFCKAGVFALAFLGSNWANAQLSGSYTIDPAGSGSTNYTSLAAFASAVSTSGVRGAVTVTVKANHSSSTQVVFGAISGTSSTNTITIDGGNYALDYSGTYEIIQFNGADYVTIKNFYLKHSNSATTSAGIRFANQSDYNLPLSLFLQYRDK